MLSKITGLLNLCSILVEDNWICDECKEDEVCLADRDEGILQCLPSLDTQDLTGCGGRCGINTQYCQNIHRNAYT